MDIDDLCAQAWDGTTETLDQIEPMPIKRPCDQTTVIIAKASA